MPVGKVGMRRAQLTQLAGHVNRLRPTAIGGQQHLGQVLPQAGAGQDAPPPLRLEPLVALMRSHRPVEGAQVPIEAEYALDGGPTLSLQRRPELYAIGQAHPYTCCRLAHLQALNIAAPRLQQIRERLAVRVPSEGRQHQPAVAEHSGAKVKLGRRRYCEAGRDHAGILSSTS